MEKKLITIKEVDLNNNCPECYSNDGLQLTFKQEYIETKLYKSITQEVVHEIDCKTCNTIIYPIRWTDDIERVYEYHKKAFTPKKSSFKLKKLAWIYIIALIVITITLVALMFLDIL